jgi:molecular chaperone GrpE
MEEREDVKMAPEEEQAEIEPAKVVEEKPSGEAAGDGAPAGEEAVDEVTALLRELEESKEKQAEYLDGWQRARAELSNARKRFQREQEQAYTNAKANVLMRLLPIADDFQRAFETLPQDVADQPWIEGVRLIRHKFQSLLDQEGVTPIEAAGQEFDPYLHQAVTHEPSETIPEGQVIGEMQKGYMLGERVLRPSVVRVSSGPPPEEEPETEEQSGEDQG